MVSDGAASHIFPIGHCIGAYGDPDDADDGFFQVRIGPDVVPLAHEQFAVWGLAHSTPDRLTDEPWTRYHVLGAAADAELPRAEQALTNLLADGLLVELPGDVDGAVDFAS